VAGVLMAFGSVLAEGGSPAESRPANELNTTLDQASYAIGLDVGRNLQAGGLELSLDAFVQGVRDVFAKSPPRLTPRQCEAAIKELQVVLQERRKVQGETHRREGQAFLAANKAKEGVIALPSGLQYKVLTNGKGDSPQLTDRIRAHYRGTFIDGTVFDSTLEQGEPAEFAVNEVIRGWTEALQRMKVGDKWRLFIPPEMAYGAQGRGIIGPNAVLIFEIELVGIETARK
jgi:FKBP-type peptidyl-prolyl cis-trans isomerase